MFNLQEANPKEADLKKDLLDNLFKTLMSGENNNALLENLTGLLEGKDSETIAKVLDELKDFMEPFNLQLKDEFQKKTEGCC